LQAFQAIFLLFWDTNGTLWDRQLTLSQNREGSMKQLLDEVKSGDFRETWPDADKGEDPEERFPPACTDLRYKGGGRGICTRH
jgi:hypothetical protein